MKTISWNDGDRLLVFPVRRFVRFGLGTALDGLRKIRTVMPHGFGLHALSQVSIMPELRPERDLAGAFSFLGSGGNGTAHPHISRANQRMRPMMRISSAVRS